MCNSNEILYSNKPSIKKIVKIIAKIISKHFYKFPINKKKSST